MAKSKSKKRNQSQTNAKRIAADLEMLKVWLWFFEHRETPVGLRLTVLLMSGGDHHLADQMLYNAALHAIHLESCMLLRRAIRLGASLQLQDSSRTAVSTLRSVVQAKANTPQRDRLILTLVAASHRFGRMISLDGDEWTSPFLFTELEFQNKLPLLLKPRRAYLRPLEATYRDGVTPLHTAAANGSIDAITLLVSNGISPNVLDDWGMSPLIAAASYDQLGACQKLIELGADQSYVSRYGKWIEDDAPAGSATQLFLMGLRHGQSLSEAIPMAAGVVRPRL